MKAIHITEAGGPEVLTLVDIECPLPQKGQALVKVDTISLNFADTLVRRALIPSPPFPYTSGLECTGVIEQLGEGVSHLKVGESVIVLANETVGGACAEYIVSDADISSLIPIPSDLDKELAVVLIGNYLPAFHMLHTLAHIKSNQTVLLYGGAGGVGTAVIQLAKLAKLNVIALVSSDERLNFVKQQGVASVINYRSEDVVTRVNEITSNKGVDLILNSAGGNTFERDFELLAPMGEIIWFGFAAGMPDADLTSLFTNHFMASKRFSTSNMFSIHEFTPDVWRATMTTLIDYLSTGKIKPVIHTRLPLSKIRQAHEMIENSEILGKLILKP